MTSDIAVFLGSKTFGLNVLKTLVEASPELHWQVICPNDSNDIRSVADEFKDFAESNNRIQSIYFMKPREQIDSIINKFHVRIGIVCGWYSILSKDILDIPQFHFWGIHHSLLPRYRGFSPLVWSIIKGDEFIGSTIFMITPEMDAGDYVAQVRIQNDENESISEIMIRVEEKILSELLTFWEDMKAGKATLYEQNKSEVTFVKRRTDADGEIQWNNSATEVHNFIRAQSKPYPGAYFFVNETEFRVYRSNVSERYHDIEAGYIIDSCNDIIQISCGNGTVINLPLNSIESGDKTDITQLKVGSNLILTRKHNN